MIIIFCSAKILEFAGVIFSGLTLYVAYLVRKEVIRNHLRAKQTDHVCNLIEYLNQTEIEVMFSEIDKRGGIGGHGNTLLYNIFEIGSFDKIDKHGDNRRYDDTPVLFTSHSKSNQILDIKKFIDHPMTPKNIADKLMEFYNKRCMIVDKNALFLSSGNFVEIKTGVWGENLLFEEIKPGDLIQGNSFAIKTWLNLKECSKNLKVVIGDWMAKNGIDDNNIREDFKTTSFIGNSQ